MKAKRPVVIAKQPYPEALHVLEQHAKQLDCPVIRPHDLVKLTAKETLQEHGSMFQMVAADAHGLPWLQPTGTASDYICCLLRHLTDIGFTWNDSFKLLDAFCYNCSLVHEHFWQAQSSVFSILTHAKQSFPAVQT